MQSDRRTLDVPVIARVNGYAFGGRMEIVLGAHFVIAADTAKFGLTEPRVGRLPLDGGIAKLVRSIPHNQRWHTDVRAAPPPPCARSSRSSTAPTT